MRTVGILVSAVVLLTLALAPSFAQQPFSDVPQDHWAYNAVNKLAEAGILEGYPDGTFKGKERLTRYEFAQAIARMLDRIETMGGVAGPPGPAGPAGAPGPAGGGGGLTPEQQALLDRLAKEFAPELAALRSDLDALKKRVEDLEAAPKAAAPTITVSGDMSWRTGVYGTKLGFQDVKSTGYPFYGDGFVDEAPTAGEGYAFGVIPVLAPAGQTMVPVGAELDYFPIVDSLKDAAKAGDFMTMRAHLNFSGKVGDNTDVFISALAGPATEVVAPLDLFGSSVPLDLVDVGVLDQMWMKLRTQFIAPVTLTVGKQYLRRGQGLLFDNDLQAIKGLRADFGTKVGLGMFLAMLDRDAIGGINASPAMGVDPTTGEPLETSGQDNYNLFYLDWPLAKEWALGVNWLQSGLGKEEGWSGSLNGKLYGLDFYGEYAKLLKTTSGDDFINFGYGPLSIDESDTAWLAGLKWSGSSMVLTGEYGEIDAGYGLLFGDLPLTAMYPRAAFDPHDINWVDRGLFLDPTNIARGWHVNLAFPKMLGKSTPVSISYSAGDAYSPDYLGWLFMDGPGNSIAAPAKWRDADSVWTVKVSKLLANSVTASLVYGRRQAENVMSPGLVPVGYDADQNPIYATDDPVQVIRAELSVPF
jgi:hypothetical protein